MFGNRRDWWYIQSAEEKKNKPQNPAKQEYATLAKLFFRIEDESRTLSR